MDLDILISYDFRVVKYSFSFDFSNCLKMEKLSALGLHKQWGRRGLAWELWFA